MSVSIYLKTLHFTTSELKVFLAVNYGTKMNLIRIFNLGILFVNPVAGLPWCYHVVLRTRDADVTPFWTSPDAPWLVLGSQALSGTYGYR